MELGAKEVVNVKKISQDPLKDLLDSNRDSFECVLDCCGVESSLNLGLELACPRANLVTVGRGPYEMKVNAAEIMKKEISIKGLFRYVNW